MPRLHPPIVVAKEPESAIVIAALDVPMEAAAMRVAAMFVLQCFMMFDVLLWAFSNSN